MSSECGKIIHMTTNKMALWRCRLGYAFLVGGLALCIIGMAIPYWYYSRPADEITIYFGLWQFCHEVQGKLSCINLTEVGRTRNTTRTLEILGIVIGIVALCVLELKKHLSHVNWIAGGMAILAGVLMITGTIVFGVDKDLSNERNVFLLHLHVGFAFCAIAGAFFIIGGIVICTLTQIYDAI